MAVKGFFFLVFEKCTPPTVAMYELAPEAVLEGHAIYRQALKKWKECTEADEWPSYSTEVQKSSLPHYGFKLTTPETLENSLDRE